MTETAGQLLGRAVPDCQWIPQNSPNPTSTIAVYPRFPNNVREWTGFFRNVRLAGTRHPLPGGQFPIGTPSVVPLRIEDDAKTRFHTNVLYPVEMLFPQGTAFVGTPTGFLGASDHVLCTNNYTVPKMPVEMKTRHNLDLRGYNFWQIYRYNDRRGIMDPNFRFKQIFGQMVCNGLHFAILSNYSDTYFLKREETNPTTLYISRVVQPTDTNPTLRECVYYISQLAIADNVGNRLGRVVLDSFSSNDDDDDGSDYHDYSDDNSSDDYDDDDYSGKRKRKQISSAKTSSKKTITSSSKGITSVDEYILRKNFFWIL